MRSSSESSAIGGVCIPPDLSVGEDPTSRDIFCADIVYIRTSEGEPIYGGGIGISGCAVDNLPDITN